MRQEMARDPSVVIARRSFALSKTYIVIGAFLAVIGILISNLSLALGGLITNSGIPSSINGTTTIPSSLSVQSLLPFVSIPLQVFAAVAFATPVLMLYVYDKNNGVLEYFLSLGMDQRDIYQRYLKAALVLALALVPAEVIVNLLVGLALGGNNEVILEVAVLVLVIAFPVVALTSVLMIAFGSLQRQRMGSNQPLGIAIGMLMVMPAYILPLTIPQLALLGDGLLAGVIAVIAVVMLSLANRLIKREKLLP